MNILLIGAAGFIGSNFVIELAKDNKNRLTLVDKSNVYRYSTKSTNIIQIVESSFDLNTNFEKLLEGQDIVYHLVSTTVPATSNKQISQELLSNVIVTANMLDVCIKCNVKKVIFISSGGTVYGKELNCPVNENMLTNPISSYGVQKLTIEKLLYLYHHMYGLDYRIIRLANPYGPYQNTNGILGAITTFTYKAMKGDPIIVFGDGSVVRDFIYIDDAVKGIVNIANGNNQHKIFNLGCGYGTSITNVIQTISNVLEVNVFVKYEPSRAVDVPVNYLDISRYENAYGKLNPLSLSEGILKTANFLATQITMENKID